MTTENIRITVRHDVRDTDVSHIMRLVDATQFFTQAEVDIAVELIRERLEKGPASGYEFVIAEEDASMLGYACFGEIPCTVGSYDLYWIVVNPAHQRAGLGQQLMLDVERRVQGLGGRAIYIDTSGSTQYASTHRFYERCGYQRIAELPDFYGPGDPKQIYWRACSDMTVFGSDRVRK